MYVVNEINGRSWQKRCYKDNFNVLLLFWNKIIFGYGSSAFGVFEDERRKEGVFILLLLAKRIKVFDKRRKRDIMREVEVRQRDGKRYIKVDKVFLGFCWYIYYMLLKESGRVLGKQRQFVCFACCFSVFLYIRFGSCCERKEGYVMSVICWCM